MLNVGDSFAHYTIEAPPGQGGMGVVFRAYDARLQRRVALKLLSSAADADARLLREARAAAALDHPGVVTLFDVGEHQGVPYIVMELVTGRTLRELQSDRAVSLQTRLGWLADVARALGAAHRRGLIHRDIKPENVMVRDDGVVKVLDFGIARRRPERADAVAPTQAASLATLTESGVLLGTPLYMAPEQLRGGPLDGRSDQFSWGVLAYELLTGRAPWRGNDALAVVASVLTDAPDEAALLVAPAPARRAILRALRKSPDERFASMDELLVAFEATGASPDDGDRPPAAAAPAGTTLSRKYTTAEVRAVLDRAIDQQARAEQPGRFSFDELLEAAREIGLDEATLREASRELRAPAAPASALDGRSAPASYAAWKRRKRRGLSRHLGAFAAVNLAMLILGEMTHGLPWTLIPGLFWGIGLAIHAVHVLTSDEDEWQEAEARKERRRGRRALPEASSAGAVEEAATLLLQTGAERRQRVTAGPGERVRVQGGADTGARDDALDAEAEALEQAEASSRRARRSRR